MAYLTVQEVRDAIKLPSSFTDPVVESVIGLWSKYLEEWTGKFFEVREREFQVLGNGSILMFLPHPPADSDIKIFLNEAIAALPATDYFLFGTPSQPEEQTNPRVRLRPQATLGYPGYFQRDMMQTFSGNFGHVEVDGENLVCPKLIKRALTLLIQRHADTISSGNANIDRVISETTDRHSYTLADLPAESYWYPTRNPEIDQIVRLYRKPAGMGFSCIQD